MKIDPAIAEQVTAAFEKEQIPFVELLVNAPSHTYAKEDVEQAAAILDDKAASLGLRVVRHPAKDGAFADHRVYETPAVQNTKQHAARVPALVGHVDTVFPRSMNFLAFRREDQRIYGPGSLDMKSGLSSILFALDALRKVDPAFYDELAIRLIVVSDEEVGSPSSKALYEELAPQTSFAMVFEAGRVEDRIVTSRKGAAVFRFFSKGKAAHAGNKHSEGRNAIHALALLIPKIEALTDYSLGRTCNVGLVDGGTAKNTVPDAASCTVDVRFERQEDVDFIEKSFKQLCDDGLCDAPEKLKEVTFRLEGGASRGPMEATAAIQSLRLAYEPFAEKEGLQIGEAPLQGGGSDANLLAAHGVPTIDGLGPFGQHFHKVEEWSCLTSLERRTRALASFIRHGMNNVDTEAK
ncbi:MAG: M20 family metallopeptidase [Deltaproteobacteria bacterium]|nr:M20 family metallopeptidase [Deltaproteobacteria bacterium]